MRKLAARAAALAAALLTAACGQTSVADTYRSALPAAREVAVGAPGAGLATGAAPGGPAALTLEGAGAAVVGGRSEYAITSYLFATSINTSVAVLLVRLHAVTRWAPTSCDDASCTWGPGAEQGEVNEWRLVVSKASPGVFDYALEGRPRAGGDWVAVISGQANPSIEPGRGHGTLVLDFDAAWAGLAHGVNPDGSARVQEDFGRVEIAYDARAAAKVQAAFLNAKDADRSAADPSARVDAWYDFQAADAAGAAGDLQLAFRQLPLPSAKTVSLHTRWATGGHGRADAVATVVDPVAGPATYHASQCWAGQVLGHVITYDTTVAPALGAEALCTGFLTAAELPFPEPFPPALP